VITPTFTTAFPGQNASTKASRGASSTQPNGKDEAAGLDARRLRLQFNVGLPYGCRSVRGFRLPLGSTTPGPKTSPVVAA
jgi:hypothetical protein